MTLTHWSSQSAYNVPGPELDGLNWSPQEGNWTCPSPCVRQGLGIAGEKYGFLGLPLRPELSESFDDGLRNLHYSTHSPVDSKAPWKLRATESSLSTVSVGFL